MSPGQLADLIVGLLLTVLVTVIGYLLRTRLDDQGSELASVARKVDAQGLAIATLTEANRAVVANQSAASHAAERIIEGGDDLADKIEQLDRLTDRLYERLNQHDTYLAILRGDRPVGG